jgi:SAM-dependent methyltransferase
MVAVGAACVLGTSTRREWSDEQDCQETPPIAHKEHRTPFRRTGYLSRGLRGILCRSEHRTTYGPRTVPKIRPFEEHVERYEAWFDRHALAHESEIRAVRELLPERGEGLEVGVGTGRFAVPLGVRAGVEPSRAMGQLASERGIEVRPGVAENLPCEDGRFAYVLLVVTICFLDDVHLSLREAHRVLEPGGHILIGFVDRVSPLGKAYEKRKKESVFYREATFLSTDEVVFHLSEAGFGDFVFRQTIFQDPAEMKTVDRVEPGYGEGSFVVVRGTKPMEAGAASSRIRGRIEKT